MQEPYQAETQREQRLSTEPAEPIDLAEAAAGLLPQLEGTESVAVTLTAAAGAPLTQTLLAIRAGVRLPEHEELGAATLQGIHGRARLVAADGAVEIGEGQLLAVHGGRHHLEAVDDTVVLVTLAQLAD